MPECLEELARVGVVESGGVLFPSWTMVNLLGFLDRAEIQTALLSLSAPGLCFDNATRERAVARALNGFAAESVTHWPKRFGFFATLPLPDVEAAPAEMSYVLDTLRAEGIGLLSNYDGIYLRDGRFDPMFVDDTTDLLAKPGVGQPGIGLDSWYVLFLRDNASDDACFTSLAALAHVRCGRAARSALAGRKREHPPFLRWDELNYSES
jgi:hypothetical protein